jgi:hypothetical protein
MRHQLQMSTWHGHNTPLPVQLLLGKERLSTAPDIHACMQRDALEKLVLS